MGDISFGSDGRAVFPTKYHGEVTLSKGKWDMICSQPERFYYKLNGEKVATTLVNPDYVRHHRKEENQVIYYKEFDTCRITDKVESPVRFKFWSVIVDTVSKKVCTIYPTDKPKPGKEYKGSVAP
ncbi:MAG: hypothetical protein HYZ93_00515 [Candidatus Omnitrophica bacterium]|nr:hypothetical protein [Candidatus Omnitrophota bacterium]